jgi:predicted acyl esterase
MKRARSRVALAALLALGSLVAASGQDARAVTAYPGGTWEPGPAAYGVSVDPVVLVPMDDGVEMRTQILWPTDPATGERAAGSFPVLLTQTPYSANLGVSGNVPACDVPVEVPAVGPCPGGYFVRRGYIVVQADQRGTGLSGGGAWDVFGDRQAKDGAALAFWAAGLASGETTADGTVGLFGCSALGISQLTTAAELGRTHGTDHPVKAMIPGCISGGMYRDTYFDNGVPGATVPLTAAEIATSAHRTPLLLAEGGTPRSQAVEVMSGGDMAYERAFWKERKWADLADEIVRSGIPALIYVGWGEGGHIGALDLYAQLQNVAARRDQVGPMAPHQPVTGRYQVFIGDGGHGCCLGDPGVQLQWYDQLLKGVDTGISLRTRTPMHLQVLADGRYVNTAAYPFTDDYEVLRLGDGTLDGTAPADGSDALDWGPPSEGSTSRTYDGPVLADGATLAGPITTSIHASSSNTNLQLTAAVLDVAPDGTAVEISHGTVVASLSDLDPARTWTDDDGRVIRPYPLFDEDRYREPDTVHRYDVNIAPKLYNIEPGHRLRLVLGTQWGTDACAGSGGIGPAPYGCFNTAPQLQSLAGGSYTVHRSAAHPSALHVPLLPYRHFAAVEAGPTPTSGETVVPKDWGR